MGIKLDHIAPESIVYSTSHQDDKPHWLKRDVISFGKPFNTKTKAYFYTELHILLESGISLKQALCVILESLKKKEQKQIVSQLSENIIQGLSLSYAMQKAKAFSAYECFSTKIGEETGTLPRVAKQLADYFERKVEYRKNITSALTYPAIILSTAGLVIFFMLKYVVPMFEDIFKQQNVELPGITKFIISISQFVENYTWWMLLALHAIVVVSKRLHKVPQVKRNLQYTCLKLPLINRLLKIAYTTQFVQAMSILISAQIPLLNALQLVRDMLDFYPLKDKLDAIFIAIEKGDSFSNAVTQHKDFFTADFMAMISVAEQTNATEYIFDKLSNRYAQSLQRQSKTFSTVLEPVVILIVGLLVGVILIAMYLPMFKLSTVMG